MPAPSTLRSVNQDDTGQVPLEKTRFVGKHSRDQSLSLYVQKRNLYEYEHEKYVEPLCGILRVQPMLARRLEQRQQVVMLGVIARFMCDFGLTFGEHIVFQREQQIYPLEKRPADPLGMFDFETKFVTALPDVHHIPFMIRMPTGMPPSLALLSHNAAANDAWGLTYYLCAFVVPKSMLQKEFGSSISRTWSKLKISRRFSKVYLAITKTLIADPLRYRQLTPSIASNSRTFVTNSKTLVLQAGLDQAAYYCDDSIKIHVNITNPKRAKISGFRVTVKQIMTVKFGSDPKYTIKSCINRYEFDGGDSYLAGAFGDSPIGEMTSYLDSFTIKPRIDTDKFLYQLGLEAKLPRGGTPLILAASNSHEGASLKQYFEKLKFLSIEYYINVHAVIPWSSNLIVKLPFHIASQGDFAALLHVPVIENDGSFSTSSNQDRGLARLSHRHQDPIGSDGNPHGLDSSMTRSNIPMKQLTGNLITFADDDDDIDDFVSHSPEGHNSSTELEKALKEEILRIPPANTWLEDLKMAREGFAEMRLKIVDAQAVVLDSKLDSHTTSMQFEKRRGLVSQLLNALEPIVSTWIPKFGQLVSNLTISPGSLAEFDPIENIPMANLGLDGSNGSVVFNVCRSLLEAVLIRLGPVHCTLAQLNYPRGVQEERLEEFSSIVDDLELLLVRTQRAIEGTLDEAGELVKKQDLRILLTQILSKCTGLVTVIPGYVSIKSDLIRLRTMLIEIGWMKYVKRIDGPKEATPSIKAGKKDVNRKLEQIEESIEADTSTIAELFEQLTSTLLDGETPVLISFLETFHRYVEHSIALFANLRDRSLQTTQCTLLLANGLLGFWQWQLLCTAVDAFYGRSSPLLFPERCEDVTWDEEITANLKKTGAASAWLINGPGWKGLQMADWEARLTASANQVILGMQELADSL